MNPIYSDSSFISLQTHRITIYPCPLLIETNKRKGNEDIKRKEGMYSKPTRYLGVPPPPPPPPRGRVHRKRRESPAPPSPNRRFSSRLSKDGIGVAPPCGILRSPHHRPGPRSRSVRRVSFIDDTQPAVRPRRVSARLLAQDDARSIKRNTTPVKPYNASSLIRSRKPFIVTKSIRAQLNNARSKRKNRQLRRNVVMN